MIGWQALLDEARPLGPVPILDATFAPTVIARIRKRKLPLAGRSYRYPANTQKFAAIETRLAAVAATNPTEAVLLADLLREPLRAYVLGCDEAKRHALVGAWSSDDELHPRIAVVAEDVQTGELMLDTSSFPVGAEDDELALALERVYMEIDPALLPDDDPARGPQDRAIWVGGSRHEAQDPTWRNRIAAVLGARGLGVTVLERPAKRIQDTTNEVNAFRGQLLVCWGPRLGNPTLGADLERHFPGRVVMLDDYSDYQFADALDHLRLELDLEPWDSPSARETVIQESTQATDFEPGTYYYFKKVGGRGGADRVEPRSPCTHSAWSPSSVGRAPRAHKGIELRAGRRIRTLEHCGRCTGGGMWRVKFD